MHHVEVIATLCRGALSARTRESESEGCCVGHHYYFTSARARHQNRKVLSTYTQAAHSRQTLCVLQLPIWFGWSPGRPDTPNKSAAPALLSERAALCMAPSLVYILRSLQRSFSSQYPAGAPAECIIYKTLFIAHGWRALYKALMVCCVRRPECDGGGSWNMQIAHSHLWHLKWLGENFVLTRMITVWSYSVLSQYQFMH